MADPPDLLARAYATLELPYRCSIRDAKRQYKRLVRRWHPDQYTNDPLGQAEAAERMRDINRAFVLIRQASKNTEVRPASTTPRKTTPKGPPPPGPRLTDEEIEALANAIGTPRFFETGFKYVFWGGSLALCFVVLFGRAGTRTTLFDLLSLAVLLCLAAAHFTRTVWLKRR